MIPRVSVVMSVYNGEHYLRSSIESILNQSMTHFEFIIVDDASTDATPDILHSFSDNRIRLLRNESNQGVTRSLNRALAEARAPLIARQDADDLAMQPRLKIQTEYMDTHADCMLLGTQPLLIDEQNRIFNTPAMPTQARDIHWRLLFGNAFVHPSVLLRKDFFQQRGRYYDPAYPVAQDYELWSSLLFQKGLHNLSDFLVRYRIHSSSVSIASYERQAEIRRKVSRRALLLLLPDLSDEDIVLLQQVYRGFVPMSHDDAVLYLLWDRLIQKYATRMKEVSAVSQNWILAMQQRFYTNMATSDKIMQQLQPLLDEGKRIAFYPLNTETLGLLEALGSIFPADRMCLISDHSPGTDAVMGIQCVGINQFSANLCDVVCLASMQNDALLLEQAEARFAGTPYLKIVASQGLLCAFVREYARQRWMNLKDISKLGETSRIAVFGGGLHTVWLEQICSNNAIGPTVVAVLDDHPLSEQAFWDCQMIQPEACRDMALDAVVLSTDQPDVARKMRATCSKVFGTNMPVIYLYEHLPPGPYPKVFTQSL